MRIRNFKLNQREMYFNGSAILASIKGVVKKNGEPYGLAKVVAIQKSTQFAIPIKVQPNGQYVLKGVARNNRFIIIAEDLLKNFNAVIQDNVVPK